MAASKPKDPVWSEVFRNILNLEEAHGFNNTAVMGGLDKFVQRQSAEMTTQAQEASNAGFLLNESYNAMSPEVRARWVRQWREALGNTLGNEYVGLVPAHKSKETAIPTSNGGTSHKRTPGSKSKAHRAPPPGLTIEAPVDRLRGVDSKLTARFKRLDVESIRDLLYLFPRRHEDYSKVVSINKLTPGEDCTVVATVWEAQDKAQGHKGRRHDTEAVLSDETGNIRVVWFGQRYLARTLKPGSKLAISGKPSVFRGQLVFESPEYEPVYPDQPGVHTGRLVPVYPLTEGLTGRNMRRLTWQALQQWLGGVEDPMPKEMLKRIQLMPLLESVFQAHYPDGPEIWQTARLRLAFDELLPLPQR